MKPTRSAVLIVLLLSAALVPATVAGQEATPTTATSTNASAEGTRVDQLTTLVDYRLDAGELVLVFDSDGGNTVTVTETAPGSGATQVSVRRFDLARGKEVVRVPLMSASNPSVLITSRLSLEAGTGTAVKVQNGVTLLAGPYDGSDVRDAALGGALGVAAVIALGALRTVTGESDEGERIA